MSLFKSARLSFDSRADLKTDISNRLKLLFHKHASKKRIVIHLKYNWEWKEDTSTVAEYVIPKHRQHLETEHEEWEIITVPVSTALRIQTPFTIKQHNFVQDTLHGRSNSTIMCKIIK